MLLFFKMQTGIESLRGWLANDVLQPLQAAIGQAHADVIAGADQLGFAGVRLTPLSDLGEHFYVYYAGRYYSDSDYEQMYFLCFGGDLAS